MIHTFRLFRTGLFLGFLVAVVLTSAGLAYLNQVGFPGRYGEWIRDGLRGKGIHLTFETLRYNLQDGMVATGVSIFEDEKHEILLLEADAMMLDLDKTKAMRGVFKLLGLQISQGSAQLSVTTEGRIIQAKDIHGKLEITSNNRAVVREASGILEGIRFDFSADLKLSRDSDQKKRDDQNKYRSDKLINSILDELSNWKIPEDDPPSLTFHLDGNVDEVDRLQTSFQFSARNLAHNLADSEYRLQQLLLSGDLRAGLVTLDDILLEDDTGQIIGRADWSQLRRRVRFDLKSGVRPQKNLLELLQERFGLDPVDDLVLLSTPSITLRGTYSIPKNEPPQISTTGHLKTGSFSYRGTVFDEFASDFSWSGENLFLRNLELGQSDKFLRGNLLIKDDKAEFDAKSNLPLDAFRPVIKAGSGLEKALSHLTFHQNGTLNLDVVEGVIGTGKEKNWSVKGSARIEDVSYKGTRIRHLATNLNLSSKTAGFSNIRALLNDDEEKARTRFQGAPSEELLADSIVFDSNTNFVTISNLRGKVWPTPIVRIFAPKTASHLEENYRFHERPHATLNGRFATRRGEYPRSSFSVAVRTTGQTDYPFLGKDLPLTDLVADVVVNGRQITVKNLGASTLRGKLGGVVFCEVIPGEEASYRGALKWDEISFRSLSKLYQFEEEGGTLTGSIDFRGKGGETRALNAEGIIAIRGGNLVALPVFGPLSPLIAGLLGDKRMGYERAKDASAHFAIRNGILQTKDFVAISTSLTLTGEGWVDLATDKMDMIIRMNARGLLGFLTLPLQPLKGIFEFRGSGNYKEPNWRSAPFTQPSRGKKDPIFQKPGRATIIRE